MTVDATSISSRANGAVVPAKLTVWVIRVTRDKYLGEEALGDWVSNHDVVGKKLFHVAGIIFENALDIIAMVVGDVEVLNFAILIALGIREAIVLFFGDFVAGFLMDTNIAIPVNILFSW